MSYFSLLILGCKQTHLGLGSLGRMMGGTGLLFSVGGSWPENVARFTSGGRTKRSERTSNETVHVGLYHHAWVKTKQQSNLCSQSHRPGPNSEETD